MTNFETFEKNGALAGLDFRVDRPADWIVVPVPEEQHDFTDPLNFAPLAVLMAPWGAVVFAVVARPAYADGTLAQWVEFAAKKGGVDPGAVELQQLGPHAGVACWAMQNEGVTMRARLCFFEDGERLVHVSCMAPDELWASVATTFDRMLASFALVTPRGATVAIAPAGTELPPSTMSAGAAPKRSAPPTTRGPLAMPGPVVAIDVALAADQTTFDPEHLLNVRMRDGGTGLVPNVLDYDEQERWATLAPASLRATLRVPFGWHVIDDGKRALVFDAAGHTQISMQLLRREGRTDDAILAPKVPELQKEWPAMRHLRTATDGMECLLVRDAVVDGQPIEQAYVLRAAPDDLVLQTRVTSSPEQFKRAGDLAGVLLRDLQFLGQPAA